MAGKDKEEVPPRRGEVVLPDDDLPKDCPTRDEDGVSWGEEAEVGGVEDGSGRGDEGAEGSAVGGQGDDFVVGGDEDARGLGRGEEDAVVDPVGGAELGWGGGGAAAVDEALDGGVGEDGYGLAAPEEDAC